MVKGQQQQWQGPLSGIRGLWLQGMEEPSRYGLALVPQVLPSGDLVEQSELRILTAVTCSRGLHIFGRADPTEVARPVQKKLRAVAALFPLPTFSPHPAKGSEKLHPWQGDPGPDPAAELPGQKQALERALPLGLGLSLVPVALGQEPLPGLQGPGSVKAAWAGVLGGGSLSSSAGAGVP